jgi:gas vesicle protein
MSNSQSDTVGRAKHGTASAPQGRAIASSSSAWTVFEGANAISKTASVLRSFDAVLRWLGYGHRVSVLGSAAVFGIGVIVGAGGGLLFAPASASATRREGPERVGWPRSEPDEDVDPMDSKLAPGVVKQVERRVGNSTKVVKQVMRKMTASHGDSGVRRT